MSLPRVTDAPLNGRGEGASPPPAAHPRLDAPPAAVMAAAPRRTDRRLLIVGILVILLGGILAASAAHMLTRQSQVLVLAHDVPAGQAITAADLSLAGVSVDPRLTPIPAGQRDVVVGKQAQVPLIAGTMLTWREVGTGPGFGAGQELVALPLADGRLPARGLRMGQTVVVVSTLSSTAPASPAAAQDPGVVATVSEVGATNPATGITVVDVTVGTADGSRLAQLAATGNVSVILLPAGR